MAKYKTTYTKDTVNLLSQTPPDYVQENYYLNELQMKIDADWPYRPNRKWIEMENGMGTEEYEQIEVVMQTVKTDKGETVSDDWYRIVFRDCTTKYIIGQRYRFAYDPNRNVPDAKKNIWIGLNQNLLSSTSAQVVCRCNSNIGSIWVDENGNNHYHYEPVIEPNKLNSQGFSFSDVAIDPKGTMMLIAQNNKYTEQYYINQRFIIGFTSKQIDPNDSTKMIPNYQVYKVTNVIRSDSNLTYDANSVGIVRIYLEMDQQSKLDDVERRIAYNGIFKEPAPETKGEEQPGSPDVYTLRIVDPEQMPDHLSAAQFKFKPQLFINNNVDNDANIEVKYSLFGANLAKYPGITYDYFVDATTDPDDNGYYYIDRITQDLTIGLKVSCETTISDQVLKIDFDLRLFGN